MQKELFEQLLNELKIQTNFSIISVNLLNEEFSKLGHYKPDSEADTNSKYMFWYSIQNYVVSLANISKLLFGVKGFSSKEEWLKRKKERKLFREILNISNSTILKNKEMRNLLEHIDENIEKFILKEPNIVVDRNIGPSNMVMIGDKALFDEDYYNLRNYLTDKQEFWLFNKNFSIIETFPEILSLRDTIISTEDKLRKGDYNTIFYQNDIL